MRHLNNQRGDAFLFALLIVAATGIIFLGTQVVLRNSQQRLNQYRLKSQMNLIEQRIRQALVQPQAYTGCNSGLSGSTGCALNMSFLNNFSSYPVIGLSCSVGKDKGCQFVAKNWKLNLSSSEAKVSLELLGSSVLQDVQISVQVPEEVLQSQVFNCPDLDPTRPIFSGIESGTGKILCRALPVCGDGEYMTGVTSNRAEPICRKLPSTTVSCGDDKFVKQFSWEGPTVKSTCVDRLDPFSYFGGS